MKKSYYMKKLLNIAVIFFALSGMALAQETRGSITGRVIDGGGGIINDAKIEATNLSNGVTVSSLTNESGSYEIPYLLPGQYRVTAGASGFSKRAIENVELRVNDRLKLDFTLEVGKVSETITITDGNTLIEASSASLGNVIGGRQASDIPIVGGNVFHLARHSAGVMSGGTRGNGQNPFDVGTATTTIYVNGTRAGSSEVTLDGAPNMINNTLAFTPPADLVQEFKVTTAAYDASYGHAAGAVTNLSIKSGGKDLHGTIYDNDSRLAARPWMENYRGATGPIPPFLRQRWGATATGPLFIPKVYDGRQKAFWSFGYEGVKVNSVGTITGTVPTLKQRTGDFSELLDPSLNPKGLKDHPYQIYDPKTGKADSKGVVTRTKLKDNIIPKESLDPVALAILNYYPLPNVPGTVDGGNNYFRSAGVDKLWHAYIGRLDYNFSERHRMFARFNTNTYVDIRPGMESPVAGSYIDRPASGFMLDDVYAFNPHLLLNVRYSLTYQNRLDQPPSRGFDLSTLGFSQQLLDEINAKNNPEGIAFPDINIQGYSDLTTNAGGGSFTATYQTWQATVTKIMGNHSFRIGGDHRLYRESEYEYGNVAPFLDFGPAFTKGPNSASAASARGQGLASFLLGVPTGGSININASRAQQSTYSSIFIHDDWKITSKLSVNLGVRYEYEGPSTERYNRTIRGFDALAPSPIQDKARAAYAKNPIPEIPVSEFQTLGGLTFAGVGGNPRGLWTGDPNNMAPRIGLAYQLTPLTVIRAGYGIFYDQLGADHLDVNQGGFNQSTSVVPSPDNGVTFQVTLSNPFPSGLRLPAGSAAGLGTFLGGNISFFNERAVNPYMQRWSLSVQRELPGKVLFDVTYVGNRGTHLSVGRNINALPAKYFSTSTERDEANSLYLASMVPNPFSGMAEFQAANKDIARSQLLRPYPHFGNINVNRPDGYSHYHSLQVELERRLSRGFTLSAAWTYSKYIEAVSYLNESDPLPSKVISLGDYPHRFVLSGIYELPFGKGKRFASNARGLLEALVGGWQLQGFYEAQSGRALGFGNAIFRGDLEDIVLPVSERTVERWFNTDAGFETQLNKQLVANIRTMSLRFTGIRGDGINNVDMSLFKSYRLGESKSLQFRIEAFNALNHAQFGLPNVDPTSKAFGTVSGESGIQRQLSFGLKFLF